MGIGCAGHDKDMMVPKEVKQDGLDHCAGNDAHFLSEVAFRTLFPQAILDLEVAASGEWIS